MVIKRDFLEVEARNPECRYKGWLSIPFQSCPRVPFLGPDPTRRNLDPTRPDPTRDCWQKVWPDPTRSAVRPFPHICSLRLNNYLLISLLFYIKYRKPNQSECIVFEDFCRFRYQEIISKKNYKIPSSDPTRPDPTRQNPAKSWPDLARPDPTRPDPRVHPTRGQFCTFCCGKHTLD